MIVEKLVARQGKITESDVAAEYLKLALPPFSALLVSSLVQRVISSSYFDPVEVRFNCDALAGLEKVPGKPYEPDKFRVVIGGQEYIISKYDIQSGPHKLAIRDGKILLHLPQS